MKTLSEIMSDANEVARVVGIEPFEVVGTRTRGQDMHKADIGSVEELAERLEALEAEVYNNRLHNSVFDAHLNGTTNNIASLWDSIIGLKKVTFFDFSVQLWNLIGGSLVHRRTGFALALVGAAGLDDQNAWLEVYGKENQIITEFVKARKESIFSLFETGKIDIVRDFEFLSNEEFVRACYILVLGREPDTGGMTQFVAAIEHIGRQSVMNELIHSQEASQRKAFGKVGFAKSSEGSGPSVFDCLIVVLTQLSRI